MRSLVTIAVLHLCATLVISGQSAVQPLPTIEVTAPKDLADVLAVSDALSVLSRKVTECAAGGAAADTCPCRYPDDVARLRATYQTLVKRHPAWKQQLLSYQRPSKEGRRVSGTLVVQNIQRQLEALKCGGVR